MDSQFVERVISLAVQIQQIPAPTFSEQARGEFIRACFLEEKLSDVEIDRVGNVYGRLPGLGSGLPVILSAHLDTVFPLDTDLSVQRSPDKVMGPGIGDNSIGIAGMMALLWILRERSIRLTSDIWFVANVGEEGLGDLRGIKEVVNRYADKVKGYIVLEGMALGQVYHRGLGVQRYLVKVTTPGGHSWVDYGRPSAVHEISTLVSELTARPLENTPRSTINVGVITGGTTVNTIASEASMELDLRSVDEAALEQLVAEVLEKIMRHQKPNVRVEAELIGQRPAGGISQEHPLVSLAADSLEKLGIQPRLNIGSTDANIPLRLGYPAVCLGITTGNGAHTVGEYINISPLPIGLEQLLQVIVGLAGG
jgi:tripeptide aminopeptidase